MSFVARSFIHSLHSSQPRNKVVILDNEPTEETFFREYNKYNTLFNSWFILIFILRSFAPFCLGLQVCLFEYLSNVEIYLREFNDSNYYNAVAAEFSNTTHIKIIEIEVQKNVIRQMMIFKRIGFIIGPVFGGVFADLYGRRLTSFVASIIWILAAGIFPFIRNTLGIKIWYAFLIACASTTSIVTFVNFAEITSIKYRMLAIYSTGFYVCGDILMRYISTYLSQWKYLLMFITSTLTYITFATWYTPESPRWLINKSDNKQAFNQLEEISGLVHEHLPVQEVRHVSKEAVFHDMFNHLFEKNLKEFFICNVLMSGATLNYSCSKFKVIKCNVDTNKLHALPNVAEVLGFLISLLLYIVIGKRNGIFLSYMLLGLNNIVGMFVHEKEIYFDFFGVMIGTAVIFLCFIYFLDIFSTFLRGTTTGCVFGIYNIMTAMGYFLVCRLKGFTGVYYYTTLLTMALLGVTVLALPDSSNEELPNYKLRR